MLRYVRTPSSPNGEASHWATVNADTDTSTSDIFYHDPSLFGKQDVVDRLIDDVAHTCGVQRSALRVVSRV